MTVQLSRLFTAEISRLQKIEWVDKYIPARAKAVTASNIQDGWRGIGLFSLNPHRVLRTISDMMTSSSSQQEDITTSYLISSSSSDAVTLQSVNQVFNEILQDSEIDSPVRNHGRRLRGIAEYLHADNTVLRKENVELKDVLNTRMIRVSGKRVILKEKFIVTTESIHQQLTDVECKMKKKSMKDKKKRDRAISEEDELELVEVLEVVEHEEREIQDCILVQ